MRHVHTRERDLTRLVSFMIRRRKRHADVLDACRDLLANEDDADALRVLIEGVDRGASDLTIYRTCRRLETLLNAPPAASAPIGAGWHSGDLVNSRDR